LGIGTVYWSVSDNHRQSALTYSEQLANRGLPKIEVLTNPDRFPAVILSGPPSPPDTPASLGAILESLGVEGADKTGMLGKMWMVSAEGGLESPPLIKKRRASFLIVTPSNKGQIDFDEARLESVWLDGQQIALKPGDSN